MYHNNSEAIDSDRLPIRMEDVYKARERLKGVINPTPLQVSRTLGIRSGCSAWLKPESLQRTGSFKMRGAYNKIASLPEEERSRGVITYSSGNHAQAVACAARLLGVHAVVVMPEDAVSIKVEATQGYGGQVIFAGTNSLQRQARALELQHEYGYAILPPFDDPEIIAGQATVGLEIVEELPDVNIILVPCGGGGLLSGVALAARELRPEIEVIGIEPAGAADAMESLQAGQIEEKEAQTICDGLRPTRIGALNFKLMRRYVTGMAVVSDEASMQAMQFLALRARLIVEPSGAVAVAAVLSGVLSLEGKQVVCVLSGGNVDPALLTAAIIA